MKNPEGTRGPSYGGGGGAKGENCVLHLTQCLTFMTSSSADLHSVESETSTTDPSSCTATTLTGTDTILPVRMAVLRTSVSWMHTHKQRMGIREGYNCQNPAGVRLMNQHPPVTGTGAEERPFLIHTLQAPCRQQFHNFLSQKLHLDHQVLLSANTWIYSF